MDTDSREIVTGMAEIEEILLSPVRDDTARMLCPGHRAELERYRSDRAWEESAAAELLLQRMCREQGIMTEPADWHWIRGEGGKPEIPELSPWHFNLTHAGGWVAGAMSAEYPVGIDLQPVGPVREGVVRRFFTDREREMLGSAKDAEESFAMIWAAREAWCKWDGRGILLDPVEWGYRWEAGKVWKKDRPVCRMTVRIVGGMALAVCGAPVVK